MRVLSAGRAAYNSEYASKTDNLTFLRGLALTNSAGLATLNTLFPGRYNGRSPNINIKVSSGCYCRVALHIQVVEVCYLT